MPRDAIEWSQDHTGQECIYIYKGSQDFSRNYITQKYQKQYKFRLQWGHYTGVAQVVLDFIHQGNEIYLQICMPAMNRIK